MNESPSPAMESSPPPYEYFRGYPGRFERERRNQIKGALTILGPLLLLSFVGTACAAYAAAEFGGWKGISLLLGLLGFTVYFGLLMWLALSVARHTTIVPYFQQQLGDIDTFARGHAVARSCQALDQLAIRTGLAPLSAFGFNDDLAREPLEWHPPAQGLATLTGLLDHLRTHPQLLAQQDQLVGELAAIEDALRKATERNIPFCLLLRTGDGTSSVEWEQRKGTCF